MQICRARTVLALLCTMLICQAAMAESGNQFSFSLTPAFVMPFSTGLGYFTSGGEAQFTAEYRLPVPDFLAVRADLSGSFLPIRTGDGCAFFSVSGGPAVHLPNLGPLTPLLFATAGYYYGVIADSSNRSGGNLCFATGTRLGWNLSPSFNLGAEVSYRYAASGSGGPLYQGMAFGAGVRYSLLQASPLRLRDMQLNDVFPVLLKYYDTHPVGKIVIENGGTAPVKELEVSFFVDKYMDNPTPCPLPPTLGGGQKVTVDLFALFSEKVLSITEATVLSGKVAVSYTQDNKRVTQQRSGSLYVKDRNAMTWDDDRKIAAFVTYKDPAVLEIAKSLAHAVRVSDPCVDGNLAVAMALHEARRLYGMSYVVDPTSSYAEQSKKKLAVDYIQYPKATLQYKSGDCDDLTVLSAAVLQGVGIDTAFITIPGHIYLAFALRLSPAQAHKLFFSQDMLIFRDDRVWVPVEITMTGSSFTEAWKKGADEWRDAGEAATLLPVAEAWQVYEPVGYFEDTRAVSFVPESNVASAYRKELARFTDRELAGHKARVESAAGATAANPATLNALGVVFAQFGRSAEAKKYFLQALALSEFLPALVNTGNVLYLEGDYEKALSYYQRAQKRKPDDPGTMLHLAQTYDKLGRASESAATFQRLSGLDPALASKYAYLDATKPGSVRAAEQGSERETMQWQE